MKNVNTKTKKIRPYIFISFIVVVLICITIYAYYICKEPNAQKINEDKSEDKKQQKEEEYIKDNSEKYPNFKNINTGNNGVLMFVQILNEKIGYKIVIEDRAMGINYIGIYKSEDSGETWKVLELDQNTSTVRDTAKFKFLENGIIFILNSKEYDNKADLLVSKDEGKTFTKISYPKANIDMHGLNFYDVFDTPSIPKIEEDKLTLNVTQGADGDYNGNSICVYEGQLSTLDFTFVKEIKN